jgi:hypothetical protein
MPQAGRLVRQPEEPVEGKAIFMPFYASCLSGTAQSDKKDPGRPRKHWAKETRVMVDFQTPSAAVIPLARAGPRCRGDTAKKNARLQ